MGSLWSSLGDLFAQVIIFFYGLTHNYGVAIIVITVLIRLILYPLIQKQMVSMREMQKIQPLMKEVQEKYKNDKERLNKELMALYKEYKVNPMSGCLPLLIQMPILLLLFQVLRKFEYLDSAGKIVGGFLWIPNQVEIIVDGIPKVVAGLAAPEQLIQLPGNGIFGIHSLGILPFLIAGSMWYQQKMTTTANTGTSGGSTEQTQKMMTIVMPLIIGFISFNLPSGLTLYWFFSTIFGIGQQYLINKKIPTETTITKKDVPKMKEKADYKKPENPVSIQEEPWIPGYEKAIEKDPVYKRKKKTKKYKKRKK